MDIHTLIPFQLYDQYEEQRYQSLYKTIKNLGFRLPIPALSKIIAIDTSCIFLEKGDKHIYENYLCAIREIENKNEGIITKNQNMDTVEYSSWKEFPLLPSNFKIFNLETNNLIGYGRQVHFRIPNIYITGFNRMAILKNLRIPTEFQGTIHTISLSSGGQRIEHLSSLFFQILRYIYGIFDDEIIPMYCLSNQCFPIPSLHEIAVEIEFNPNPQPNIDLENFRISMEWYPLRYFHLENHHYNSKIAEDYLNIRKEMSILEFRSEYYDTYQMTNPKEIRLFGHFSGQVTHILISFPYDTKNQTFLDTQIKDLNLKFNNDRIKINPKKIKKYENFNIIPFINPIHPNFDNNNKAQLENLINFSRIDHMEIEMSINLPMIDNIEIYYGVINVNALIQDRSFVTKKFI